MRLIEAVKPKELPTYFGDIQVTTFVKKLSSIKNFPINGILKGNMNFYNNLELRTFKGGPVIIDGYCSIYANQLLEEIGYQIKEVTDKFLISDNERLHTLAGSPHKCGGFTCSGNDSLKSFKYCPRIIVDDNFTFDENGGTTHLNEIWDVKFVHNEESNYGYVYNGHNKEMKQAVIILNKHKSQGHDNFLLVAKELRENGLGEYI